MLRISGKGIDGFSKAFSTDEFGQIKISSSGGTMAKRIENLKKLDIPTYDGLDQPTHPSVLRFYQKWNGWEYWMAMTPHSNGSEAVENPSILVSNDGINWEVPSGVTNPLFGPPDEGFYADTVLVFAEGVMYLYYAHYGISGGGIYRTSSTDGVTWSEPVRVQGETDVGTNGIAYVRKGVWVSFSRSNNTLVKMVSEDGLYWQRSHPVYANVGGNHWHSTVYYDGSGFHFLIGSYGSGEQFGNSGAKLYYGYSMDGNRIAIDPTPLWLPEKGTESGRSVYTSQLVPYDNQTLMAYVSTRSVNNEWTISAMRVQLNVRHSDVHVPLQSPTHQMLFNNFEPREYKDYYYEGISNAVIPEFSYFKEKSLYVHNTLDTDVTLRFTIRTPQGYRNITDNGETLALYTVPANSSPHVIEKDVYPILGNVFPGLVNLAIKPVSAPTTGAITITLTGYE